MQALAVLLDAPRSLALRPLTLARPGEGDVVVDVEWSGVSAGTERLLWSGLMPSFPGMGYPLVPGYEAVGRVAATGAGAGRRVGERVFVPGARCFEEARCLFGASASRLVVPGERAVPVPESLGERAVLLALAATARHALAGGAVLPDLIVGHGVLGRLAARLVLAAGGAAPTVWEREPVRREGAEGYEVLDPARDARTDYACVLDASGDAALLDALIARLRPGGEVVLAGFYAAPLAFAFPPAFVREARIRVAAQWQEADLAAVNALAASGALSLDGLLTHRAPADEAPQAYETAFGEAACLKMILDWKGRS